MNKLNKKGVSLPELLAYITLSSVIFTSLFFIINTASNLYVRVKVENEIEQESDSVMHGVFNSLYGNGEITSVGSGNFTCKDNDSHDGLKVEFVSKIIDLEGDVVDGDKTETIYYFEDNKFKSCTNVYDNLDNLIYDDSSYKTLSSDNYHVGDNSLLSCKNERGNVCTIDDEIRILIIDLDIYFENDGGIKTKEVTYKNSLII